MEENKNNVDDRLWEFIDGQSSIEEASAIEKLIETNKQWKEKYRELLELHQLVQSSALEEPSLRFTKNVMEEIAKYQIAPAAKTYINNKIYFTSHTMYNICRNFCYQCMRFIPPLFIHGAECSL